MFEKEFNKLPLLQRMEYVAMEADLIGEIKHYSFRICLYTVHGYYIEAFYDLNTNYLTDVAILDPDDTRMNLYANKVDISGLLK
ncbi:MAG: hypothetical protein V4580_03330 [Bacteroidota bacterium]